MKPLFDPSKPMALTGWSVIEGWLPSGLTLAGIEHTIYKMDGQPEDLSGSFIMSFIRDGEKDVPRLYRNYFKQLCEALGKIPDVHLDSGCSETRTFARKAAWFGELADIELHVAASWEYSYYEYVDFAIYCCRSCDILRRSSMREQLARDEQRMPKAESGPGE
jgi:hypothetical protein